MSSSLSPTERTLRARTAAYARAAQYDGLVVTAAAREAAAGRFLDQVDPDRTLPEAERLKRAEAARKQYFTGLAYKSARARRARAAKATKRAAS